jgi:hypothetical protein
LDTAIFGVHHIEARSTSTRLSTAVEIVAKLLYATFHSVKVIHVRDRRQVAKSHGNFGRKAVHDNQMAQKWLEYRTEVVMLEGLSALLRRVDQDQVAVVG